MPVFQITQADLPFLIAIVVLMIVRRFCFVNTMMLLFPTMVIYRGGDSISIMFNTVAVLFLMEVDNLLYEHGLSEDIKAEVESKGRVWLEPAQVHLLKYTKAVHVLLITMGLQLSLRYSTPFMGLFIMLVGGLIEQALIRQGSLKERALRTALVLPKWIFGMFILLEVLWAV
eukprot:SAG22_NODE_908_length_6553_cov_5.089247_5_plen_172_part_00